MFKNKVVWIIIAIVAILFFWVKGVYNNMVTQDEGVKTGTITLHIVNASMNQNLENTVKGSAAHEKETLEGVVNARAEATKTTIDPSNLTEESLKKFQSAQGELGNALSRLMLVLERYPDLKANQNFMELQAQLEGTENRISVERKRFNEVAQSYNTYIRQFPNNILSGMSSIDINKALIRIFI